jgi:hypothetical protein
MCRYSKNIEVVAFIQDKKTGNILAAKSGEIN